MPEFTVSPETPEGAKEAFLVRDRKMHETGRGPRVTCMVCTESQDKRCLSTCALDILPFHLLLHVMTLMALLITHLSITCFDTRTPLGGGKVLEYI